MQSAECSAACNYLEIHLKGLLVNEDFTGSRFSHAVTTMMYHLWKTIVRKCRWICHLTKGDVLLIWKYRISCLKKNILYKFDLCFVRKISEIFHVMICWVSADQRDKSIIRKRNIYPYFEISEYYSSLF